MENTKNTTSEDALDILIGLNDEDISVIQDSIADSDYDTIQNLVSNLHAADMANLYQQLSPNDREVLIEAVGDELNGEIISHLDDTLRDNVLKTIRPKPLAKLLTDLETDDAIHLIEGLDEEKQKTVLRYVPLADRAKYKEILAYEEGAAARIMRQELVSVPEIWTVGHVIDMLRKESDSLPDMFYSIIVLGKMHKPLGLINLANLLRSSRSQTVKTLLDMDNFYAIPADMEQQDVAYLFKMYDLLEAPVIDSDGRLIGIITVDDVVDIIEEEAEDDILKLGGVKQDDFYQNIFMTARLRLPWLLINLGTAVIASFVIGVYAETVEKIVALAILMPIVASMGGNAGTQTLTIAVRALATNDLTPANAMRIVWKESLVGGINGFVFAIISGLAVSFFFDNAGLGMVISVAMIINLLIAGIAGILVPLSLEKAGADPAVASTVFLTTITDVVGFFVFLGLSTMVLL